MKSLVKNLIAALLLLSSVSATAQAIRPLGTRFGAPSFAGVSNVANPIVGDIAFDSTDGKFYGFDGTAWSQMGGSGANTSLSNLTTTSINKSFHFNSSAIEAGDVINILGPEHLGDTGYHMQIKVGDATTNPGNLYLQAGNAVGDIGAVVLIGRPVMINGSQGTIGHVWTEVGANGEGSWQLAPYTAGNSGDWATAAPTTVAEALDRLASLAKTLNGGNPVP